MDWGECGLGRYAIVGRIPYWGCKSNLCGADLEGGGASNLTGADRGRMWIGAVSPASLPSTCRDKLFLLAVTFFPPPSSYCLLLAVCTPVTLPSVLSAVCIGQNSYLADSLLIE